MTDTTPPAGILPTEFILKILPDGGATLSVKVGRQEVYHAAFSTISRAAAEVPRLADRPFPEPEFADDEMAF